MVWGQECYPLPHPHTLFHSQGCYFFFFSKIRSYLKFVLISRLSPASPTQPAVISGCCLALGGRTGAQQGLAWGEEQSVSWGGGRRSRDTYLGILFSCRLLFP